MLRISTICYTPRNRKGLPMTAFRRTFNADLPDKDWNHGIDLFEISLLCLVNDGNRWYALDFC